MPLVLALCNLDGSTRGGVGRREHALEDTLLIYVVCRMHCCAVNSAWTRRCCEHALDTVSLDTEQIGVSSSSSCLCAATVPQGFALVCVDCCHGAAQYVATGARHMLDFTVAGCVGAGVHGFQHLGQCAYTAIHKVACRCSYTSMLTGVDLHTNVWTWAFERHRQGAPL